MLARLVSRTTVCPFAQLIVSSTYAITDTSESAFRTWIDSTCAPQTEHRIATR